MGYQVYWANDRFQGYGVPAYCDYHGCKEEIDRGLGYVAGDKESSSDPQFFFCHNHEYTDIENFEPEEKERPGWIEHILDHLSWEEWRIENPDIVERYKGMIDE